MGYLLKGVWVKSGNIETAPLGYLRMKLSLVNYDMHCDYRDLQIFNILHSNADLIAKRKKDFRILKKMRRIIKDELKRREERA